MLLTAGLWAPTNKRVRFETFLVTEPFVLFTEVILAPRHQDLLNLGFRDFWLLALIVEALELLDLSALYQALELLDSAIRAKAMHALKLNRSKISILYCRTRLNNLICVANRAIDWLCGFLV